MGLKGAAIGGVAGWFFGGPLGAIFGAVLGSNVEKEMSKRKGPQSRRGRTLNTPRYSRDDGARERAMIFCASAAAMLAKMAKADGVVTRSEITSVECAFERLGFDRLARDYAVNVFRKAKDDSHTIYEYAYEFASAVSSLEVRELLYELLWDVACADGTVSSEELSMLRQVPRSLGIRPEWFDIYASERLRGYGERSRSSAGGRGQSRQEDPLAAAYRLLGASPQDDGATLKRKYRELAKKYHPDALKAQGLPDEMLGKATERMSKINAAWGEIKAARGL